VNIDIIIVVVYLSKQWICNKRRKTGACHHRSKAEVATTHKQEVNNRSNPIQSTNLRLVADLPTNGVL
jgi:hypothetical protein